MACEAGPRHGAEATAGHDALWCGLRALCAARLAACQDAGARAIAAVARRELRFACTALAAAEQLADRRVADAQRRCALRYAAWSATLSHSHARAAARATGDKDAAAVAKACAAAARFAATLVHLSGHSRPAPRASPCLWDLAARGYLHAEL